MINSWYSDSTVSTPDALHRANETLHSAIVASSQVKLQPTDTAEALSLLDTGKMPSSGSNTVQQNSQLNSQPRLSSCLIRAQKELGIMSPYWRNWFILQYKYYVLRTYGDPYPTLPGALEDFVRHTRRSQWMKKPVLAPAFKFFHWVSQRVRELLHA